MRNIRLTVIGFAALTLALTMNFRHAVNEYGILGNSLNIEVLAQTNSTGSQTTAGGWANPWFWKLLRTNTACTASYYNDGSSTSGWILKFIIPKTPIVAGTSTGTASKSGEVFAFNGKVWECYDGYERLSCSRTCKAE